MFRITYVVLGVVSLILVGCAFSAADDPDKLHHAGDGFRNLHHDYEAPGFGTFLRWKWNQLWNPVTGPEHYDFPLAPNTPAALQTNTTRPTLTWIGHATVLLQLAGRNILTDPHFTPRASPVSWAGPKRAVPPGLALDELPHIDVVVISHDHYDSLDAQSVRRLATREGGEGTLFLVPLGLKRWFAKQGIDNVVELDWWEHHVIHDLRITAVPVQHWSKRSLFGRNRTLWAGWTVSAPGFRFLFAGDSGYSPDFAEIGRRLGPFDLAAIPIGAYEPRWMMRPHHVNPEEAVQLHLDVRSRRSVAIHWGTFVLTDEPLDEPPKRLRDALHTRGVSEDEFLILRHGETLHLPQRPQTRSQP